MTTRPIAFGKPIKPNKHTHADPTQAPPPPHARIQTPPYASRTRPKYQITRERDSSSPRVRRVMILTLYGISSMTRVEGGLGIDC